MTAVDVCSCGHPVAKHVLWNTEYSRCEGIYSGQHLCRCSGLYRKAVALIDLVGEWEGIGSRPGRFFRRDFKLEDNGAYETFNRAVEKALADETLSVTWEIDSCDGCGSAWSGPFYAYGALVGEDKDLSVEFLCGICNFERKA